MLAQTTSAVEGFNARAAREKWAALCDEGLGFESAKLASLLAIWRSVKGERPLPAREDFSARLLAKHLRDITFVERVGARYRFRLFGSALAAMTGDWTGKFLDEVVPEPFLASWVATYGTTLETGAPLRFVARFRASHLEHVMAETLTAPLAGDALLISVAYSPVVA
jgi:hypothetical protein